MDPKSEPFFTLRNLRIGRGDETPQFDGTMVIKGRDVASVQNLGRGGANFYRWIPPFTREWATAKLFPIATKIASVKEPEFKDLYARSGSTALDSLVFDAVENQAATATKITRSASPAPVPPSGLRLHSTVLFGQVNGEKTKGKVIKINRKTVLVESLEARGSRKIGSRWKVSPSLLTVV